MYNRALDTFRAVAEEGSFSKAAAKMYITHTAVIKQVSGLEAHLGVRLFHRSPHGVTLTAAGQALYTEALQIMKQSELAVQRVRQAQFALPKTLRLGTSPLCPSHDFMDLWDELRSNIPGYALKIVFFDDSHRYLDLLGGSFDFVIGAYNRQIDREAYGFLQIGEYEFTLAVPRTNSLSREETLSFRDLHGQPMMMMKAGVSPINDSIRKDIVEKHPEISIVDTDPSYSIATFNRCVERNIALLSLECWDRVHPDVRSIPLEEKYSIPYGMIYAKETDKSILDFIMALKHFI